MKHQVFLLLSVLLLACSPTSTVEAPPTDTPVPTSRAGESPTSIPAPTETPTEPPSTATNGPQATDTPEDAAANDLVEQIVEHTNVQRQEHGCPALTLHPALSEAARRHSRDMAENDFFSHTSPDGGTPADRVEAAGYDYSLVGENLAVGLSEPERTVGGWMESDEHRENILNCDFVHIGIGYYYLADDPGDENWNHYWTQVLAAPLEAAP